MHFSSLLWSSSTAPGHSGDHYIHQQGATLPSQDQTSNSGRWKEMRQIKKKENVKAGKRIGTVQLNKTEIRTVLKWQTIHLFSLTSAHPVVKNKSCFVFFALSTGKKWQSCETEPDQRQTTFPQVCNHTINLVGFYYSLHTRKQTWCIWFEERPCFYLNQKCISLVAILGHLRFSLTPSDLAQIWSV